MEKEHDKQLLIHQAAWDGDLKTLKKEIEKLRKSSLGDSFDINFTDSHGNTALHLALHNKQISVVEYLLTLPGIQPLGKSISGWSPLQESLASGDKRLVEMLFRASEEFVSKEYKNRLVGLVQALKKIPDFYVEIQWGFGTWVPFISRFCPSDRYRIWKKGHNIRVDSTLVGYENLQWVRGAISLLFNGDKSREIDKTLWIIDHNNKLAEAVIPSLHHSDQQQIQREIEELMRQELIQMDSSVNSGEDQTSGPTGEKLKFKPCITWSGTTKTSNESGYHCLLYEMDSLTFSIQHRSIKDKTDGQMIDHSIGDSLKTSFSSYISDEKGKIKPLLYQNEMIIPKEKSFRSTLHLSKDFPLKPSNFIPIIDALLPSWPKLEKLKEILSSLPENQFPVKTEIPIFPTITATILFEKYSTLSQIEESIFSIPSDYQINPN